MCTQAADNLCSLAMIIPALEHRHWSTEMGDSLGDPFLCPSDVNRCYRHPEGLFLDPNDRFAITCTWSPKRAFRIRVAIAIPRSFEKVTMTSLCRESFPDCGRNSDSEIVRESYIDFSTLKSNRSLAIQARGAPCPSPTATCT
ncbi:hypothetical protein B296_00037177 [Ensete ventricosum]|uniref:Uncharacterized protein n=1 Tax=Ensete ventricosum TaxID=4639 RepID=A0A426ZKN1_ENSVE|nr:hypothetical protein B296_00037177 [Ensete ventricosum]